MSIDKDFPYGFAYDIENCVDTIREHARNSNGFVLEIGAGKGDGSTIAIQEGLSNHPNPVHVTVDIEDDMTLYKPSVYWWHFVKGDSTLLYTLLMVDDITRIYLRKPGLIFIDTFHQYQHLKRELELWQSVADKNTVWLFHDTWMCGEYNKMTDACKEFARDNGRVYEDLITEAHGLGRIR